MAILPRDNDYTAKDFEALSARMQNALSSVFPDWTDQTRANFGNILAEFPAHVGDTILVYVDRAAREGRFSTAQLRRSLLGHSKLIGYQPAGAHAATVDLTFTLAAAMPGTLTLAAGTRVKTAEVTDPVRFQLLADLVFLPGETSKVATVEHSETVVDTFVSSGLANQRFLLRRTPFLEGSVQMQAANGAYTVVSNFLRSSVLNANQGRDVVVVVDQSDRALLRCGNGINGAIPIGDITVTYKTGGGAAGRLEPHTLRRIEGDFKDSLGNIPTITVDHAERTTGGTNRLTNEQIKLLAPESTRVIERATAREDYEIAARQVPGVARALMLTKNQHEGVLENAGILFIVPPEGGTPSQTLLTLVRAQFEQVSGYPAPPYPLSNTFRLTVQAAPYLLINITAKVFKRAGATGASVKAAILASLTDFFAVSVDRDGHEDPTGTPNLLVDFGYNLKNVDGTPTNLFAYSDVMERVRGATGVLKLSAFPADCTLNGLHEDVLVGPYNFPKLGTVVLVDGDTGQVL